MVAVIESVSLSLGLIAAIIIAYPALHPKKITIPTEAIANDIRRSSILGVGVVQGTEESINQFNSDLWDSFQQQRRFTALGLTLLVASLSIQFTSSFLS